MPAHDLALLTEAAREAGKIALGWWKSDPQVWEKPGQGPVTEADLAVNVMLEGVLRAARPSYGWLSEESVDDGTRLDAEHVFIIDPIDGTRAFIAGEAHFAHSLAVAQNGQVTAAAVYLPALGQMFTAWAAGPALMNGEPIAASAASDPETARVLATKPALAPEHWRGPVPGFSRHFRASIAYRLCLVANGSYDAMLTFRPSWEWDIAAGLLICAQAGAAVRDAQGRDIRFNSDQARAAGVVAAAPGLIGPLLSRLA